MTGGAFKNSSNLLGRKRELEELEAVCGKALTASEQIEKELHRTEAMLQEKREELETIKNERHEASLIQNTRRMNVSQLEEKREEWRFFTEKVNGVVFGDVPVLA